MKDKELAFETLAVHAGVKPDPSTGAIMTPIFATSTFVQTSPGKHQGYDYARTSNPTRKALEVSLASLEGGDYGLATSAGVAAIDMIVHLLNSGDEIISCDDVYGGTSRLFRTIWERHGIHTTFLDLNRDPIPESKNIKLIWIETPTNPLLKVIDIERIATSVHRRNPKPLIVVDNTFATPYFQKPLDLGAHIVLHSTTKYLNGHSDVVGGGLVTRDKELHDRLHHIQNSIGGIQGPFDSFLVLRGIKTLALRMKRHEENARLLAEYLEKHRRVEKVLYPGLSSHPDHSIAKKQMSGFGGMLTFFIEGGLPQAARFLENLKVFSLAESLGGVESLVDHPAIMTHASIPKETREKLGITDALVRLSVGIENVEDLKADLTYALDMAYR